MQNRSANELPAETQTIKVVTQPAQNPDVNICDLAVFRALACALRKRRRVASGASRTAPFDLDKLAADSHAAFNDYSSETLEEMLWAHKTIIMDSIIESKGGNDYDRRRTTEERESRKRARGQ